MASVVDLLELAGKGSAANAAKDESALEGLPPGVQHAFKAGDSVALAAVLGINVHRACYLTAPDHEPMPVDSPDELPEDPEQQDSEAA